MTEGLNICARPRPVRQLNRKMVVAASTLVVGLLMAVSFYALEPGDIKQGEQKTLYNISHKQKAEGLEALPKSYTDIKPATPKLGPPYMGDVGPALHRVENFVPDIALPTDTTLPFRPSAEEEGRRAERIRKARQQVQAQEAGVFFQISGTRGNAETEKLLLETDPLQQLLALGAAGNIPPATVSEPSAQGREKAFLKEGLDDSVVNSHALVEPVSPYSLMAGTVIAASLITGINSDFPGQILAQVTEHIYDTVTGQYLLIPQGSKLIGRYDSDVSFGQQRVLLVWDRIIWLDGSSIRIDNLIGTDKAGYAGLSDSVNWHTGRLMKGIGLATLLGVGSELAYGGASGNLAEAIRDSSQSNINQAGQKIVEQHLNIPPTITIRPGWPVRVLVGRDMILKPYGGIQ